MLDFCARRPFLAYALLAYLLTWIFTIPFVYLWRGPLAGHFEWWLIVFLPGAYGPTLAALAMAGVRGGRAAVIQLVSRLFRWRASWRWYLFAALTPFATLTLAICMSSFRTSAWEGFVLSKLLVQIPVAMLVALPFGPLGEELGWRGFALPLLQQKFSTTTSSLILGAVWTFWHSPMFAFPGAAIPSFLQVALVSVLFYLVYTVATSVLLTTLFNHTGGSVLLAILLHTTHNAAGNAVFEALPEPTKEQRIEIYVMNIAVVAAVALVTTFLAKKGPRIGR